MSAYENDATLLNDGQPFTRRQAADVGLAAGALARGVANGQIRRVLRSVYVDAAASDSRDLRCRSLQLVMPVEGVLFGTTAAWVLGVDAFQPEDRFVLTPQCVVPHGTSRSRRYGVSTVEGYIATTDITELGGLRLTVPDRTAVDMLRRLRRPFAMSAADAMAHAGLVLPGALQQRVDQLRGFPGIVQARQLARLIEPLTESPGESWQRLRLLDARLPRPVVQYWVRDRSGRGIFRLDLAYDHVLLGCEYDGAADHTGEASRQADAERRELLRQRWGWRVLTCRRSDILGPEPWLEVEVGRLLGCEPLLPRRW